MPIILHAADLHLDSPFSGLPPEQAALRRQEQRELLRELAELVPARGVQLVLLAGDLLDRSEVHADTIQTLCRALEQMAVPVVIAPGNHDPAPLYRELALPGNVTVFSTEEMEEADFPALGCAVHGRAFVESACSIPFASLNFRVPEDGRLHLLCLHGEVGGQNPRFGPIDPADLAKSGARYAALGHIHKASGLQKAGDTVWAYPGCPEGRGFDETGDKGVLIGRVDREGAALEFVPTARRRYHIVEADLTEAPSSEQAVLAALPEGCENDVLRVILTGEREALNMEALSALLAERCFSVTVNDRTTLRRDLWERMGEDSLTGYFLRALREAEEEDGCRQLALRFGMAALEHGEDPKP